MAPPYVTIVAVNYMYTIIITEIYNRSFLYSINDNTSLCKGVCAPGSSRCLAITAADTVIATVSIAAFAAADTISAVAYTTVALEYTAVPAADTADRAVAAANCSRCGSI